MGRSSRTIVALISINFTPPDIDTYESVTVQDNYTRQTLVWNSGDVLNDFANALEHARDLYADNKIDEIILHSSCEEFVRSSNLHYTFDLDSYLVERFVYD